METDELLEGILDTGHAEDCAIDPEGSPAGAIIRVLFSEPYLAQDADTGVFANTAPDLFARASDLVGVVPAQTVLRILEQDYVVHRIEKVPGGAAWRRVVLNEAAQP